MSRTLSSVLLTGLLLVASAATGHAQGAQATMSVGAVVVAGVCTAGSGPAFGGAQAGARCDGPMPAGAARHAVMTVAGGVAGPAEADGARVTIAY